jgi:hypothetical protein
MLGFDAPLTFREFMIDEPLPLAVVFREVLLFVGARKDAVLFGAQAVNAYCETERMTQDIDLLSTSASALADAMRAHLAEKFQIAARVREVAGEKGFRVYQLRKPKNRHLVDVRQVDHLPASRKISGVQVIEPADLIAMKVEALAARQNRPKGDTDRADLRRLLMAFPELKRRDSLVSGQLAARPNSEALLRLWTQLAAETIEPDQDDEY